MLVGRQFFPSRDRGWLSTTLILNFFPVNARPYQPTPAKTKGVYATKETVSCGQPMPEYEIQVRDGQGHVLPERHVGPLYLRGPSVMSGYFDNEDATREVLSDDGWLNTGDLAYLAKNNIYITGRQKDLLIIRGRSVWPQDLEKIAEQQPEVRTGDAAGDCCTG